jgi:murein DD-endopeptidase MepM/ murein hydrolase activator NlpD
MFFEKYHLAKRYILTQNYLLLASKVKLHWLFVAFLLPLTISIATLSAAVDSEADYLSVRTIKNDIVLPSIYHQRNPDEAFWQTDEVRTHDTLNVIFDRMTIRDKAALKFFMYEPETSVLNTRLIPGRNIDAKTDANGKLLYLAYELPDHQRLVAKLAPDGFKVNTQTPALIKRDVFRSVTIKSSLFGATDEADVPDRIALKIAEIFSSEIDFNEDLHPNDTINVVYEGLYHNGGMVVTGDIIAVEVVNRKKIYRAVHFGKASSKSAYFTPEGKSLQKSFLRSPLEFARVSSSFSRGRYHPVLHRFRAHKGVDLAAREGTRIKASGDGVVKFKGRKGGYGNVIILQHRNQMQTLYGHLSRFRKGLRKGQTVEQGDIIGYVGMSGLATGPHLHYEFLLKGVHHDPMTVQLPKGIPLEEKYKLEFKATASIYMEKLKMLTRNTMVASK